MKPDNFHEQTLVMDNLADYVTRNFGLIIIDTFTTLYRVKIAESPEKTFDLNRELNRQIALLAQIAKTQKIVVLITSQVHSFFEDTKVGIEPVATRVLKFWADTIIAMKPTENTQVIRAVLEKAPKKVQPLSCRLKIEESGIHEYPIH